MRRMARLIATSVDGRIPAERKVSRRRLDAPSMTPGRPVHAEFARCDAPPPCGASARMSIVRFRFAMITVRIGLDGLRSARAQPNEMRGLTIANDGLLAVCQCRCRRRRSNAWVRPPSVPRASISYWWGRSGPSHYQTPPHLALTASPQAPRVCTLSISRFVRSTVVTAVES
jgi:hypothetical protein